MINLLAIKRKQYNLSFCQLEILRLLREKSCQRQKKTSTHFKFAEYRSYPRKIDEMSQRKY